MNTLYLSIVTLLLVAGIFKIIWTWARQVVIILTNNIPSPGIPWPILGHSHLLINVQPDDVQDVLQNLINKDKKSRKYLAFLGPSDHTLFVYHPETVEVIFNSSKDLISKSWHYKPLEKWLMKGLLTSSGQKWQLRRKLLTPAFHFNILNDSLLTFNSQADVLCDILLTDLVEHNSSKEAIDVFPYIQRSALDMLLETAMGVESNVQHNRGSNYAHSIQRIVHIFQQRQFFPWYQIDEIFRFTALGSEHDTHLKVLHGFTDSVIKARREEIGINEVLEKKQEKVLTEPNMRLEGKKKIAFLDLLLQVKLSDGSGLSNSDIREEVDTFMFEGHDTTTCSLAWTIFLIGHYPKVQQNLYDEQCRIFGEHGHYDNVEQHHLSEMKYLECCIKESLRLYPSVPVIGRTAEAKHDIDGYTLNKGETVVVLVWYLHRNPLVWDNPDEFIPERFLDGQKKIHPFAYVPFSAGARNCIGQKFALLEEKTVLSKLIRRFEFESADSIEKVKPIIEIITRPKGGIRVRIKPRDEH